MKVAETLAGVWQSYLKIFDLEMPQIIGDDITSLLIFLLKIYFYVLLLTSTFMGCRFGLEMPQIIGDDIMSWLIFYFILCFVTNCYVSGLQISRTEHGDSVPKSQSLRTENNEPRPEPGGGRTAWGRHGRPRRPSHCQRSHDGRRHNRRRQYARGSRGHRTRPLPGETWVQARAETECSLSGDSLAVLPLTDLSRPTHFSHFLCSHSPVALLFPAFLFVSIISKFKFPPSFLYTPSPFSRPTHFFHFHCSYSPVALLSILLFFAFLFVSIIPKFKFPPSFRYTSPPTHTHTLRIEIPKLSESVWKVPDFRKCDSHVCMCEIFVFAEYV